VREGDKVISKDELGHMYWGEGMTYQEIAGEIGVSQSTVGNWMKKYDIRSCTRSEAKPGRSHISKLSKESLYRMYWHDLMTISNISYNTGISQPTIYRWMKEYHIEIRTRYYYSGINSPHWKGGISFEPYCDRFNNDFKEAVRERDDYMCQLCGSEQNGRKLDVHHIHYDKANCYPDVVALCRSCNVSVNSDRDYWERYFEDLLLERGLLGWSISA
jgi:transposase